MKGWFGNYCQEGTENISGNQEVIYLLGWLNFPKRANRLRFPGKNIPLHICLSLHMFRSPDKYQFPHRSNIHPRCCSQYSCLTLWHPFQFGRHRCSFLCSRNLCLRMSQSPSTCLLHRTRRSLCTLQSLDKWLSLRPTSPEMDKVQCPRSCLQARGSTLWQRIIF